MEIQEIISFITVADQKSFTKAADKLGYSKSSITIHIKNLENELNIQLIERLGKRITLTHQGEIFYQDAIAIIDRINEAKEHLSFNTELTGTLKLGTIDSLSTTKLPSYIERFHTLYPKAKIIIHTDTIQGLLNKLLSNDIDLAYLYDVRINDYSFHNESIRQSYSTFVCSNSHPFALKKRIELDDLKDTDLILTEKDASYRRTLDEELSKQNILLEPIFEAQSTEIILKLLSKNLGISYLPEYVITEHNDLISLDSPYNAIMEEQLLYHKDKKTTREMKEMIYIIKEDL